MKNTFQFIGLSLIFLLAIPVASFSQILISDAEGLAAISNDLSGSYILENDIELIGEWQPISFFQGVLDGNGHVIRNLNIKGEDKNRTGLFERAKNAQIKNLGIENASIDVGTATQKGTSVGILIGEAMSTSIENSYISNSSVVGRQYVGSFIGKTSSDGENLTQIKNCYSTAFVKARGNVVGGIVGSMQNTSIENTYFSGMAETAGINTGGIAGLSDNSSNSVTNCLVLSSFLKGEVVNRIVGAKDGDLYLNNNYARADLLIGKITDNLIDFIKVPDSESYLKDLQGESISYNSALYSTNISPYSSDDIELAYSAFNENYLRTDKNFYRADYGEDDVAAIWVQAIYFDMALNAYNNYPTNENKQLIEDIYEGCKNQYDNYNWDNGPVWFIYDDIMWWTMAFGKAYQITGESKYLALARTSFERVWSGSSVVGDHGSYDPVNGGMYWNWNHDDPAEPAYGRMSCINFTTVIGAMNLYNATEEEDYLDKAKEIYQWANDNLMDTITGRVYDTSVDKTHNWIYNHATCIGSSVLLYKATGEKRYLQNAVLAANFAKNQLSSNAVLPFATHVEAGIYTAIFAPYIADLIYEAEQYQFLPWMRYNIDLGWYNRDKSKNITYKDYINSTPNLSDIESYDASGIPALMLVIPPADNFDIEINCKSEDFYTKNLNWDFENTWRIGSEGTNTLLPMLSWQTTPLDVTGLSVNDTLLLPYRRTFQMSRFGSHGQQLNFSSDDESIITIENTDDNQVLFTSGMAEMTLGTTKIYVSSEANSLVNSARDSFFIKVFDASIYATEIYTVEDLNSIADKLNGEYKLMNDIDLNNVTFSPIGSSDLEPFSGRFYGNGYTISNLSIRDIDGQYIGFFGYAKNAIIQDLTMEDVYVVGKYDVGGLFGKAKGTTFERVSVSGDVRGTDHVGGLGGGTDDGDLTTIINSYVNTVVKTNASQVGGILGVAKSTVIENCYSAGSITAPTADQGNNAGGIIGLNEDDNVSLINVVSLTKSIAGGTSNQFVARGNSLKEFENCYARNDMSLSDFASSDQGLPRAEGDQLRDLTDFYNQDFYADVLGWDFDEKWEIEANQFPTLIRTISTGLEFPVIKEQDASFNLFSQQGYTLFKSQQKLAMQLYSISGVLLASFVLDGFKQIYLSKGVYLVKATKNNEGSFVHKFVVI